MGKSFTNSQIDWKEGTYEYFKDWAVKHFGLKEKDSDDDDADVPARMMKAKDIEFRKNRKGVYILPHYSDYPVVKDRQRVIRGYIGKVYRQSFYFVLLFIFSNRNNRGFHWEHNRSIPVQSGIQGWPADNNRGIYS